MMEPPSAAREAEADIAAARSSSERRLAPAPRVIDSQTLLAGRTQLAIVHNHTVYFLRQTRFGKLILTK